MPEDASILSEAIAKHFGEKSKTESLLWPSGYREPEVSIVDQVLKFVTHEGVDKFCEYLRRLPAEYQRGGRKAPRDFPWYVVTAKNFASEPPTQQEPTQEVCRHRRPYDVCGICLTPEKFGQMTECF